MNWKYLFLDNYANSNLAWKDFKMSLQIKRKPLNHGYCYQLLLWLEFITSKLSGSKQFILFNWQYITLKDTLLVENIDSFDCDLDNMYDWNKVFQVDDSSLIFSWQKIDFDFVTILVLYLCAFSLQKILH